MPTLLGAIRVLPLDERDATMPALRPASSPRRHSSAVMWLPTLPAADSSPSMPGLPRWARGGGTGCCRRLTGVSAEHRPIATPVRAPSETSAWPARCSIAPQPNSSAHRPWTLAPKQTFESRAKEVGSSVSIFLELVVVPRRVFRWLPATGYLPVRQDVSHGHQPSPRLTKNRSGPIGAEIRMLTDSQHSGSFSGVPFSSGLGRSIRRGDTAVDWDYLALPNRGAGLVRASP